MPFTSINPVGPPDRPPGAMPFLVLAFCRPQSSPETPFLFWELHPAVSQALPSVCLREVPGERGLPTSPCIPNFTFRAMSGMVCLCSSVLLGSKLFLGGGHLQYIRMDVLGVEYGGKNTSEGEQGRQNESEKVRWKERVK